MGYNDFQTGMAKTLRLIGSDKCLEKAKRLACESPPIRSLNLRDLDLNASNIASIAAHLNHDDFGLKSISISYNSLIGDSGVIHLIKNLPDSIRELGMVNCGISDIGGIEILKWMKISPNLQMICMEQNDFSDSIKVEFKNFSAVKPQILVVY